MSPEPITSTATIHDATSSQISDTSPPTRHMLFHCWPRAENSEAWKRTVLRLLGHIDQFDGIRSVAIVTGEGCESVETVKAEFRGVRIDNWIIRENIPDLGEVVTWLDLLETIKGADGLCWYGHSKATSYEGFDWGPQSWMESMFEVTLSMPHQVHRLILDEGHLFAGPYRKKVRGWRDLGSQTEWHYSGTFFWFDVRRVFQRNWANIEQHRFGVESWPSMVAAYGEGACITGHDTNYGIHRHGEWTGKHQHTAYLARWRDRAIAEKFSRSAAAEAAAGSPRPILNIVTAVSRPGNLRIIQEYIDSRLWSFDVRWYCIADSRKVKSKPDGIRFEWGECDIQGVGGPQRNVALDRITEGWVWFLDDDNIPHPDFDRQLVRAMVAHSDAAAFVFSQDTLNGKVNSTRYAAPENVRHGEIDLAQYVVRRDAIGRLWFDQSYIADWNLFRSVWQSHRERIHFRSVATYYNALENCPFSFVPPHHGEIEAMERLIGSLDGMKIAEPGSWVSSCSIELAKRGATVTAIEPKGHSVRAAEDYIRQRGLEDRVRVIQGDATILEKAEPERFDLMFHAGLLYHLENPVAHFRKVSRLCQRMFLDTHVADGRAGSQFSPMTTHEGYEGQWYFEPAAKGELDGMGWRSFWLTRPMLDQLLNECGLRIVEALKWEDDHRGRGARVALLLERVGDPPVVAEYEGRKVFGIGLSKTGTTSLNEALRLLGLDARHWQADERTIRQTIDGVTALDLLETADALTDIQATAYFKELDTAYPNARFVMTVRDETSWLQSMSRHMNECERRRDPYINKMHQRVYRAERFDEARLKEARAAHEAEVVEHFADRPGKLLVLPILSQAGDESWRQLCEFLGTAHPDVPFPHLNQSAETQAPA